MVPRLLLPPLQRRVLLAIFWLAALGVWVVALQRDAPLFINLGAGDGRFARGFRSGWERDGLQASGETMFHWTEDGARLEFPVEACGGRPVARLRIARFAPGPANINLFVGDRTVDRWIQPSRGWDIREVTLGDPGGPLTLRFRSESPSGDALGAALDWVEVRGLQEVRPIPALWPGLLAWAFGVPLLLASEAGLAGSILGSTALVLTSAAAISLDRLGGLSSTAAAGIPAMLVVGGLLLVRRALGHPKLDGLAAGRAPFLLAAAFCLIALIAIFHPFFYYPDVDNHARYLAAIRADPWMILDSSDYQLRTGSFTQEIGGRRIAFPYSAAFHVTAWPLARFLGEVDAIKTVAVLALGTGLLLVHALARTLGLGLTEGLVAEILVALLPVTSSGLTLARYPTFLGQALDLLLLVYLCRRYPFITEKREALVAATLLMTAQATYTGSLLNVFGLMAFILTWAWTTGDRARTRRLLGAYAGALFVVLAVLYGRFIPVVFTDIAPHLGESQDQTPVAASPLVWLGTSLARLTVFYGPLLLPLSLFGLWRLESAPRHARALVAATGLAGLVQLGLRPLVPTLFRHAKEMQLLAGPVGVLASLALVALWRRGGLPRLVAAGLSATLLFWSAQAALRYYAASFFVAGR